MLSHRHWLKSLTKQSFVASNHNSHSTDGVVTRESGTVKNADMQRSRSNAEEVCNMDDGIANKRSAHQQSRVARSGEDLDGEWT